MIILEEGYALDLKTSQKLGFEKAYTIEKGAYPIVYDSKLGFYKITCKEKMLLEDISSSSI